MKKTETQHNAYTMKIQRYAALSALVASGIALPAGAETLDTLAEFGNATTANPTSGAGTARGADFSGSAAGAYAITAGGSDFWGTSDQGSFIYDADQSRAAGENFSVIVRSVSVAADGAEALAPQWGRTGVMARKSPDADGSANVAHIRKSGGDAAGTDPADTLIQGRPTDGAGTDRGPGQDGEHRNFAENTANGSVRDTPIWLALHRFDGEWYSTWAVDNAGTPGTWSTAIQRAGTADMAGEVYLGLAHQSHPQSMPDPQANMVINTAVFDNFSVIGFDPNLGAFPTVVSCNLVIDGSGTTISASGVELGTADLSDVDWEVRYIGDPEVVTGVLAADIYLGNNPGNLAAVETALAGAPSGSTQIEQIHWAGNAYTTTNAGGLNLFAAAVPGSFGANQDAYGVEMTGEIHIPNDTDRGAVESILFHDGVDDFCYLAIDGVELINDNTWTNLSGNANANNNGAQGSLDVSDPKFDDGEWVSFRMITWEGGGGDDALLVWDALDTTGADSVTGGTDTVTGTYAGGGLGTGTNISFANDFSDKIPAANFRALVPGLKGSVSDTGQPAGQLAGAIPAGTQLVELWVNGDLCSSAPTTVSVVSAEFTGTQELTVVLADAGAGGIADLDETTLTVTLDGNAINPAILKVGTSTTLTYTFPAPPAPYTNHAIVITGTTTAGTGSQAVNVSTTARSLPFLAQLRAGLAAPPNATVGWDYMEFDAAGTLGRDLGADAAGFTDAQTVISTAGAPLAQANQPYINHSDPDAAGGRGDWLPDLPMLSNTVGIDDNQIVTYARTTITIGAGEEGDYSIRVTGDDGFGLRIAGAEFTSVAGEIQNELNSVDTSVVFRPVNGGNGNAVAVCNFPAAGDYLVEFFGYEAIGGAYQEISWAPGVFTDVDETTSWVLLGDTSAFVPEGLWADIPEAALPPAPTDGEAGWSTYIYYDASVGSLTNTLNFLETADTGTAVATVLPMLNHSDDAGGGGVFGGNEAFPGDPNPGAGTDNIAMIARAFVVAPVTGNYTIQVRADDGFMLRFIDPANAFSSLNGVGSLRASSPNEVYFPANTGNAETRATVHLEEGVHELVYVWWEAGGGANFEISSAPGVVPNHGTAYELLNTDVSATNLYVSGSKPIELVISEVTYDEDTDRFTLTFNSKAGTNYAVFADTDLVGFETEVDDSVAGTGGDVTTSSYLNPFPGASKVFFRVQVAE